MKRSRGRRGNKSELQTLKKVPLWASSVRITEKKKRKKKEEEEEVHCVVYPPVWFSRALSARANYRASDFASCPARVARVRGNYTAR